MGALAITLSGSLGPGGGGGEKRVLASGPINKIEPLVTIEGFFPLIWRRTPEAGSGWK